MKIQVLGSGCPTCKNLYEQVQSVLNELEMKEEVEYITDITKLIEEGIATSPALKIGDNVVCAGRTPSQDEIKEWLNGSKSKSDQKNISTCSCGGSC